MGTDYRHGREQEAAAMEEMKVPQKRHRQAK
jgi:hypothetical protein